MKLFKHRGDIYVSKAGFKASREERILVSLLIVIVVLTIAFLAFLGAKYSSFSDFIAGDDVTVTQQPVDDEIALPDISGKINFLVIETDDEQSTINYLYLVQMDSDSKSYKTCTLSPNMTVDGKSVTDLYLSGGGALIQSQLTSLLGFDVDYYIAFKNSDFDEFIGKLGSFIYPMGESVKFNGGAEDNAYSIHIGDGEQNLNATDATNLMRYYSNDNVNFGTANELVLYGLTQLFNADNFDNCEKLFRLLITNSSTNITVRDFENGKDSLMVFCLKNTDITVYSCIAQYKGNALSTDSQRDIKGYFNK